MNLNKLFKAQKELDNHIVEEKGLQEENLLPKKILALQVELGELANKWRGFKFWSEDQEPRTEEIFEVQVDCDCNHESYACGSCMNTGKILDIGQNNPLLEEYVDCLHFILSIGIELKIQDLYEKEVNNFEKEILENIADGEETTEEFLYMFNICNFGFPYSHSGLWLEVMAVFIRLGEKLGFKWQKIEQAYFDKNNINHERQENGY